MLRPGLDLFEKSYNFILTCIHFAMLIKISTLSSLLIAEKTAILCYVILGGFPFFLTKKVHDSIEITPYSFNMS